MSSELRRYTWTEGMWNEIVPYLESGKYQCLVWESVSKKTGAPNSLKEGPLRERALRAARIYLKFREDLVNPLPREAVNMEGKLRELFGLTPEFFQAALPLARDASGLAMTYDELKEARRYLGLSDKAMGRLNRFSRVRIYAGMAREGKRVEPSVFAALERELTRGDPPPATMLPELALIPTASARAAALSAFSRLGREDDEVPLTTKLAQLYAADPEFFPEETWRAKFADVTRRLTRRLEEWNASREDKKKVRQMEAVRWFGALFRIPERFQKIAPDRYLTVPASGTASLEQRCAIVAMKEMDRWPERLWSAVTETLIRQGIGGAFSSLATKISLMEEPPPPPKGMTLWERAYRAADLWRQAVDRDIINLYPSGFLDVVRRYYGVTEEERQAASHFATVRYAPNAPASVEQYREAKTFLGLTLDGLALMGPEAQARQVEALLKEDPNFEPPEVLRGSCVEAFRTMARPRD
jgi:hypothetical protein